MEGLDMVVWNSTDVDELYQDASGMEANASDITPDMIFNETSLMSVIVLSILFVVASIGNMTVFITLLREGKRRTRVNLFIMHLSVADLFVALLIMPLEIGWALTVSWQAGDVACRIMMFFRAFGYYLSSFVLIAISFDRYFAVARPLSLKTADDRGKMMLIMAWIFSVIASVPQSVIFHLEHHPDHADFKQCVDFNFYQSDTDRLIYNMFNMVAVYLVPLIVITVSYSLILCLISRKARQIKESSRGSSSRLTSNKRKKKDKFRHHFNLSKHNSNNHVVVDDHSNSSVVVESEHHYSMHGDGEGLRSTANAKIEKAKARTLKMTIVIVSAFIICWTPYYVISFWWLFHTDSAKQIHPKVTKGLFLFAVSNSCADPIIYGMFSSTFRRAVNQSWFFRRKNPFGLVTRSSQRSHDFHK